jgi:hypothetical protein
MLRESGIKYAFPSPIEAIFYEDPQIANLALYRDWSVYDPTKEDPYVFIESFRKFGYVESISKRLTNEQMTVFADALPVYVINPALRNWQRSLRISHKAFEAFGIKLHPNYHSYHLTDGAARELLAACGEVGLPVIVQMRMQDTRSHHPLMQVPDVDINEVLDAAAATPQTQFVIGGIKWGEASGKANDINALPNVWLDISQCEVVDVLRRLIRLFGAQRLLFGTHAPFFYVKSALLKLEEAQLTEEEKELITEKNAKELFRLGG